MSRTRVLAVAGALLVFTNGPILLFSKSVLDRTSTWEDLAVWPWLVAAAVCGGVLTTHNLLTDRRRITSASQRVAVAAVGLFSLAALASTFWSVNPSETSWRSAIYVGMALLAWAIARLDDHETAAALMLVTSLAVAASVLLVLLRPDLGLKDDEVWKGVYTNPNSLAPLAAIGLLVIIRFTWGAASKSRASEFAPAFATATPLGQQPRIPGGASDAPRGAGRPEAMADTPRHHLPDATDAPHGSGRPPARRRPLLSGAARNRIGRATLGAAAPIALLTLWSAESRTAMISLAAAGVAATLPLLYFGLRRHLTEKLAAAVTLAATGACVAGGIAAIIALWDTPTLGSRRQIWSLTWDRILDRPFHGHGFFTFWEIEELTMHVLLRRGSAHNSLVEVGLALGLLGAIPFVIIAVLAARNAALALWRRPGPDSWLWAALVVFLLVENIAESFVLWFSYNWILLMAAAMRPPPPPTSDPPPRTPPADDRPSDTAGSALVEPPMQAAQHDIGVAHLATAGRASDQIPSQATQPDPIDCLSPARAPEAKARRAIDDRRLSTRSLPASLRPPSNGRPLSERLRPTRLRSGWTAVAVLALAVLALWLPDLDLPLGNSDDGRITAFSGLKARNFWELGPLESDFGARVDPSVTGSYAHHPPLKEFMSIASAGLLGDSLAAVRLPAFAMGAATVVFMASLLRGCGLRWGPVLLSVAAMASTGFFYLYGRLGVGFSLLVASAAAVAWLRKTPDPPRGALAGTAALAALAAMQSWIALVALAPLTLWLLAARRPAPEQARARRRLAQIWSPAATALVAGAVTGVALTAAWMLNAAGVDELLDQFSVRARSTLTGSPDAASFTFGEFLTRQWAWASEALLAPPWLRALLAPVLAAGLIDRRTRVPTAITLGAAAALTFGLPQGAWSHMLWNFPWLAPATIGLAALLDAATRRIPRLLHLTAGTAAAVAIAATMLAVVGGSTRARFLTDPAHLGAALEQAAQSAEGQNATFAWAGPGLPGPRWAVYYLDVPARPLGERRIDDLAGSDLVILREDRLPPAIPDAALDGHLTSSGRYFVLTAESLTYQ